MKINGHYPPFSPPNLKREYSLHSSLNEIKLEQGLLELVQPTQVDTSKSTRAPYFISKDMPFLLQCIDQVS